MRRDLTEAGRIILAKGEQTGHCHEVRAADAVTLPEAQYFEEPDGTRVLLCLAPCVLTHQEHRPIALEPTNVEMHQQGDVLLIPRGPGCWTVEAQREAAHHIVRPVLD